MAYRRVGRAAGTLLAVVSTLLIATALPAAAHNELKSSDPKDGASLDAAPAAVALTFSEELIPGQTTVTVTGPDAADAAAGAAQITGVTVTVAFKPTTAGVYTVAYKVTADDGDVTDNKFTFTLTAAAIPAPPTATTTTTTTTTAAPPTASSQAAPAATENPGSGTTWWPYLVAGLAVVLIAVVLLILRRRRTS